MAAHHSVIHSQKEFANPETGARVNTAEPVKREDFHEAYDQGGCLLNDSPNRTLNHAQRRSASSAKLPDGQMETKVCFSPIWTELRRLCHWLNPPFYVSR